MIPQLITVSFHNGDDRRWRLFVPVLPMVLLVSPILVLVAPICGIACIAQRVNPFAALFAVCRLMCALPGTRVDIAERGRTTLRVNIR